MFQMIFNFVLDQPRWLKRLLVVCADGLGTLTAFVLAFGLANELLVGDTALYALGLLALTLPTFGLIGMYQPAVRLHLSSVGWRVLLSASLSALAVLLFSLIGGLSALSASALAAYWGLCAVWFGGVRLFIRWMFLETQSRLKTRVIIYGAGEAGRQLAASLEKGEEYSPVAFVDDSSSLQGRRVAGIEVHAPQAIAQLAQNLNANAILLAIPSLAPAARRDLLARLEPYPIRVQTVPSLDEILATHAPLSAVRQVSSEELLSRDPIPPLPDLIGADIAGKCVLVTGAGGSIGSELCRQVLAHHPAKLILLDLSEYALYETRRTLSAPNGTEVRAVLGTVRDRAFLERIFQLEGVQTIYHAAAYKHVPLVEDNPSEAVLNNAFGTLALAEAATASGVGAVILVSTDKAVRPTNVLGASKRAAELICQAMAHRSDQVRFSIVRFGNVLGSSGSVVPLFQDQIAQGGPVTVTHRDVTRFFMTVTESAELVIQAGALGGNGEVFVLDMGAPVRITDLARRLIRLSGRVPYIRGEAVSGDIEIVFSGLRPGEKLHEDLLLSSTPEPTVHPRIMTEPALKVDWAALEPWLEELREACVESDHAAVRELLASGPLDYTPTPADRLPPQPKQRTLKLVRVSGG